MVFFGKSEYAKRYTESPKVLGQGNFAIVKEVVKKGTNEKYASKIIDMKKLTPNDKAAIETEIKIMENIQVDGKPHPNIIGLFEKFQEKTKTYLILELVTGGELFDRIVEKQQYSEADAAHLTITLVQALGFLHEKGVVHRDLKPENLLYANEREDAAIKIADFGLAKESNGGNILQTACGTPGYVAPEVLAGKEYNMQVDMWSLGVILYILLCGFPPFYEEDMQQLFNTIMNAKFDFPSPWWDDISAEAKACVKSFLTVNPSQRYCAYPTDAPNYALQDPWFLKYNDGTINKGNLGAAKKQLKKYQATKKMKKVGEAIIAAKRMSQMMGGA